MRLEPTGPTGPTDTTGTPGGSGDLHEGVTIHTGPLPSGPQASEFHEGATIRTGPVPSHAPGSASPVGPIDPVASAAPTVAAPAGSDSTGFGARSSWDSKAVSRPFSQSPLGGGTGTAGIVGTVTGSSGPLPVGAMVAGRYRVIKVLGVGGMGEVYHVLDEVLEVEVALKVMRSEVAADVSFLQRFRNELLVARQITHPNVVRIHDLGQDGPLLFMTMDLVKGQSLGDWMEAQGPIPHSRAVEIIRQVADGLRVAHQKGVVHRDLKPANILLDAAGQSYVTDFGIARSHSFSGLTRTGEVLGTPDYLAPEQARGEEVDGRTDLYALGLIFFEMVSGKKPFVGGTLYEILAQHMNGQTRTFQELGVPIEPGLEAVISRCLAPDRNDRYDSAAELVADLDDLERPRLRRAQEKRRRKVRRAVRVLGIAAAGMVTATLGWWAWTSLQNSQLPTPSTEVDGAVAGADAAEPEKQPIPDLPSVLILPLQVQAGAEPDAAAWASQGLPDLMRGMVSSSGEFRVVPGSRVDQVLRNLELSPNRLSEADMGFLADLFAADRLVSGVLDPIAGESGPAWSLTLKITNLKEGGVASRAEPLFSGQAPATDPARLLKEAAGPLAKALGLEGLTLGDGNVAPSAMTDFYLGRSAAALGDFEGAAQAFERATSIDPEWLSPWLFLAEARRAQGLEEESSAAAEQAISLLPTEGDDASGESTAHPLAYRARALWAELQGQPDPWLVALQGRLEQRPVDTEARFDLALAYGALGQLDKAVEQLEISTRIDPTDSQAWYYLGRYTIVGGDPERAVDDYLVEALAQARRSSDASGEAQILNALGIGYRHLGKVEQASRRYADAAEIQQALGDRNGYAKAQMNLGDLSIELGRFEDAEQQLTEALVTFEAVGNRPGQANAVNALGVLRERQGRFTDALEQYRQALRLRLEDGDQLAAAESYYNVGFAYLEMANYTDAGLNLEQALTIYQQLGNTYGAMLVLQSRASAGIARGDWQSAERDLLDALATSRELQIPLATAASHGSLARLALYQGRYRDGFSALDKALGLVEQQDNLQGRIEMTLARSEGLLDLGAAAEADALLSQVELWLGDKGNPSQLSVLRRLQGESALLGGDLQQADQRFDEAMEAAEAGSSAATLLAARIAASAGDAAGLGEVVAEADRLGHVPLELRALEARAAALIEQGASAEAESVCRQALGMARKLGDYGRKYRLLALQSAAQRASDNEEAAERSSSAAVEELQRIRQQVSGDLSPGFEALPSVAQLGAAS